MACKKSELVSAINSYAAARVSADGNLLAFSADLLGQLIETLEFAEEETKPVEEDGEEEEEEE